MTSDRVHIFTGRAQDRRVPFNKPNYILAADVTVEIDVGSIIRYFGLKAASNRSGRSRALSGMIKIKAENISRS